MTTQAIEAKLKEMGATGVVAVTGYVQANFDSKAKADQVAALFEGEAEVSADPVSGYNMVWCK